MQSSNAQQGQHDSSNAYNYYGQQWGGHYVSVVPLHQLIVVFGYKLTAAQLRGSTFIITMALSFCREYNVI